MLCTHINPTRKHLRNVLRGFSVSSSLNNIEERIMRPPTGTRDFDPPNHRFKEWLFAKWSQSAKKHGFQQYDAPIVEFEELYTRKSGEDVSKQMYNLQDKDGQRLSLRPEMTPSLARMVSAKLDGLALPIKWFSMPQCWRYETTTVGRRREHYQWNMDVWGVGGVEAEAELLSAAVASLKDMGLTSEDVVFKINSRKLMNGLMEVLGVPRDLWTPAFLLMDKADKLTADALSEQMGDIGLDSRVTQELIASLQITDVGAFSELFAKSSVETAIGTEGVSDLLRLQELLGHYGLREWTQFDASVVRGLAYYTGVVFEAFDRAGALRAICGGGRYDHLLQSMFHAERSVPAVGFGFGDAVVEELLRLKGLLPVALTEKPHFDAVLYFMDPQLRAQATELATTMRRRGVSVRMITEDRWKPKAAFAHGDKMGARYLVMLAMSEHKRGEAVLKDLRARSQCTFKYCDIDAEINKILGIAVSGL